MRPSISIAPVRMVFLGLNEFGNKEFQEIFRSVEVCQKTKFQGLTFVVTEENRTPSRSFGDGGQKMVTEDKNLDQVGPFRAEPNLHQ